MKCSEGKTNAKIAYREGVLVKKIECEVCGYRYPASQITEYTIPGQPIGYVCKNCDRDLVAEAEAQLKEDLEEAKTEQIRSLDIRRAT